MQHGRERASAALSPRYRYGMCITRTDSARRLAGLHNGRVGRVGLEPTTRGLKDHANLCTLPSTWDFVPSPGHMSRLGQQRFTSFRVTIDVTDLRTTQDPRHMKPRIPNRWHNARRYRPTPRRGEAPGRAAATITSPAAGKTLAVVEPTPTLAGRVDHIPPPRSTQTVRLGRDAPARGGSAQCLIRRTVAEPQCAVRTPALCERRDLRPIWTRQRACHGLVDRGRYVEVCGSGHGGCGE
jgi:hypothetical protein